MANGSNNVLLMEPHKHILKTNSSKLQVMSETHSNNQIKHAEWSKLTWCSFWFLWISEDQKKWVSINRMIFLNRIFSSYFELFILLLLLLFGPISLPSFLKTIWPNVFYVSLFYIFLQCLLARSYDSNWMAWMVFRGAAENLMVCVYVLITVFWLRG